MCFMTPIQFMSAKVWHAKLQLYYNQARDLNREERTWNSADWRPFKLTWSYMSRHVFHQILNQFADHVYFMVTALTLIRRLSGQKKLTAFQLYPSCSNKMPQPQNADDDKGASSHGDPSDAAKGKNRYCTISKGQKRWQIYFIRDNFFGPFDIVQ